MAIATPDVLQRLLRRGDPGGHGTAHLVLAREMPRLLHRWTGLGLPLSRVETTIADRERLEPPPDGLHLRLLDQEGRSALAALPGPLVAAIAAWRLTAEPLTAESDTRSPGLADAAICRPFAIALMDLLDPGAEWRPAPRAREDGVLDVALDPGPHERIELEWSGAGGGSGVVIRPLGAGPAPEEPSRSDPPLQSRLGGRVPVRAILARTNVPLGALEALEPGTLLPLMGVTLDGAALEGGGRTLSSGRIGQLEGRRAIRLDGLTSGMVSDPAEADMEAVTPASPPPSTQAELPPPAPAPDPVSPDTMAASNDGVGQVGAVQASPAPPQVASNLALVEADMPNPPPAPKAATDITSDFAPVPIELPD